MGFRKLADTGGTRVRRWLNLALIPLLAFSLVIVACEEEDEPLDGPAAEEGAPDEETTAEPTAEGTQEPVSDNDDGEDIEAGLDDAEIGQTVTVSSEIDEVVQPGAFTIEGDEVLGLFGEATLVINNTGSSLDVPDDGVAEVTGEVVEFSVPDIEEEFGDDIFTEEEAAELAEFDGEKAIMASTVEIVPEEAGTQDEEAGLDEAEIGETVTVSAELEDQVTPQTFTISSDEVFGLFGDTTLVINNTGQPVDLTDEGAVEVTGEVVQFTVVDIEEDLGEAFFDDEEAADLEQYEDEKALLADSITFIPEDAGA